MGAWTGLIWLGIATNGSEIEGGGFLECLRSKWRRQSLAAALVQLAFGRRNGGWVGLLCGGNEQATDVQAHPHTGLVQPAAARSK